VTIYHSYLRTAAELY